MTTLTKIWYNIILAALLGITLYMVETMMDHPDINTGDKCIIFMLMMITIAIMYGIHIFTISIKTKETP